MLTDKQIKDIRIYYQYGYTYGQIAERTGAAFSEIRKTINDYKEEATMGRGKNVTPEIKQKIIKMRQEGEKHEIIANALDISVSSVQRVLSEAKKKEPVTAATATSSEQNIISSDDSASIITEKSDNVKPLEAVEIDVSDTYEGDDVYRDMPVPPRKFAQVTIKAIWVRIGCQQEYIKQLSADMDENYKKIKELNDRAAQLDEQMKIAEAELEQLRADYKFMGGEDFE